MFKLRTVVHVQDNCRNEQAQQRALHMPIHVTLMTPPGTQQLQQVPGCALRTLCCHGCRKPDLCLVHPSSHATCLLLLLLLLQARGVFDAAKREELVRLAKNMAPAGAAQPAAAAAAVAVAASSRAGQEVMSPVWLQQLQLHWPCSDACI
jgi:hypothetical protein